MHFSAIIVAVLVFKLPNAVVTLRCFLYTGINNIMSIGQACTPERLLSVGALTQSSRGADIKHRLTSNGSIRFTCRANVTGWVFTAEASGRDTVCRHIERTH